MAEPISTLISTERLVEATAGEGWLDRINDNFGMARWVNVRSVTSLTDTATSADDCILLDATSNAVTLTLPPVADVDGMVLTVIAINVSNTVTLDGNASETINGSATKTIGTINHRVELIATSSGWHANYSAAL